MADTALTEAAIRFAAVAETVEEPPVLVLWLVGVLRSIECCVVTMFVALLWSVVLTFGFFAVRCYVVDCCWAWRVFLLGWAACDVDIMLWSFAPLVVVCDTDRAAVVFIVATPPAAIVEVLIN